MQKSTKQKTSEILILSFPDLHLPGYRCEENKQALKDYEA